MRTSPATPLPKNIKRTAGAAGQGLAAKIFAGVLSGLLILVGGGSMYVATHLIGDLTTTNITKDPTALGIDPSVEMDDSIKNIALFAWTPAATAPRETAATPT